MIIYLTYNDQPSGVYWSQVTDVVDHCNTLGLGPVRLVALVSLRGFGRSRKAIHGRKPNAIVLPMVPRAHNWYVNRIWVYLVCRMLRPKAIVGRGIFATALGLNMRQRGLVEQVCYDARSAYGAEWEEFRVVDDDRLIKECVILEERVVHQVDLRMAVSNALVDHWRERFGYHGDRHVVIPCTLGRDAEQQEGVVAADVRERFGWGREDIVLVYSGTVVGWQSLELLRRTLDPWLQARPTHRLLFLSEGHPNISVLMARYPLQVQRQWVPHEQVRSMLLACDHGLLLRDACTTNKVASPTKFAEYLSAGLPVVISEGVGDLSDLVHEQCLGHVYREVEALELSKPSQLERERMLRFAGQWFTKKAHQASYWKILQLLCSEAKEWEPHAPLPAHLPLVSIIVPSFNKRTFIGAVVGSVTAQSDPRWELLVIDDGSTDGSPELLMGLAATEPRIRVTVLEQNRGANHCRNLGIVQARGRYVVFLDADDLLAPDCLANRLAVMNGSGLDLAVFTMEVFSDVPGDHGQRWVPDSSDPLRDFFRHDLPWQTMQPIWDTGFLKQIGGFDESFSRHQDVELHTRALLVPKVHYRMFPGIPDCYYRIAEERKVIDPLRLLRRFSESAVSYHDKFLQAATRLGQGSLLLGIIHRTYLQVLLSAKKGLIDHASVTELEATLLAPLRSDPALKVHRWLFRFSAWYNSLPIRVPGINYIVFKCITLLPRSGK